MNCNGNKCTFGFNAEENPAGNLKGNVEFVDHGPEDGFDHGWPHVHGYDIIALEVLPDTGATEGVANIWGICRLNGDENTYYFYVHVHDNGEPGTYDTFYIALYTTEADALAANSNFFYSAGGQLGFPDNGGGNIQVHVTL